MLPLLHAWLMHIAYKQMLLARLCNPLLHLGTQQLCLHRHVWLVLQPAVDSLYVSISIHWQGHVHGWGCIEAGSNCLAPMLVTSAGLHWVVSNYNFTPCFFLEMHVWCCGMCAGEVTTFLCWALGEIRKTYCQKTLVILDNFLNLHQCPKVAELCAV